MGRVATFDLGSAQIAGLGSRFGIRIRLQAATSRVKGTATFGLPRTLMDAKPGAALILPKSSWDASAAALVDSLAFAAAGRRADGGFADDALFGHGGVDGDMRG